MGNERFIRCDCGRYYAESVGRCQLCLVDCQRERMRGGRKYV